MKKLLVIAAMAVIGSVVANAQIGESSSKKIETTYTTTTTTVNVEKAPFKGYKGMVDFVYGVGVGDVVNGSRIGFSTVHGYQFNPYIYVGGGLQFNYYYDAEEFALPIFANARVTWPFSRMAALYFDYRIGYTVGDALAGFYMSPAVGIRVGRKSAFNFSIGYEYQGCRVYYYDYYYGYSYSGTGNAGAVTFRIGVDF